jgi:ectoine hydroxylase-related dioxygenase (phytanoyl-CoA dioxygenase family)
MTIQSEFEENGFFILRDFFAPKELLRLNELVDGVHQQWLEANQAAFENDGLINMHSLTQAEYFVDEPENRLRLFKAIAPAKLVELLDEVFERDIHFHNTQLFFNPFNPDQQPYWHRDLQFSDIPEAQQKAAQPELLSLHVRIPLVKEVGLELVPGTHKRWDTELERKVRLELDGHKNSETLPDSLLLDLEPGDLVVFSAQMIHRGNYTDNDARKALDLCVGSSHELLAGTLDPRNLPTAEELEQLSTDDWYRRAWEVVGLEPTPQAIATA